MTRRYLVVRTAVRFAVLSVVLSAMAIIAFGVPALVGAALGRLYP